MNNLLIYGDAPDHHTGLARIARDLATITSTLPEFHVGTFGRGAIGSSSLPWPQFSFSAADQWGENLIQKVWQDFTRSKGDGQILTVWDASRLLWYAGLSSSGDSSLDVFLGPNRTFSKWGYFMIDGTGPDGITLPYESRAVLSVYDRVVVSSEWGAQVARASGIECEWIPHPIDGSKFKWWQVNWWQVNSTWRELERESAGVKDRMVVGCCMTNQARKDWPTAFAAAAILARQYKSKFLFWVHTDSPAFTPGTYWNLHALAHDYGLPSECLRITLTGSYTDSMMAAFYNACDVTMVCSGGEGFGYPIAESLSCGCPCVTQAYAAGAELLTGHEEWLVPVHAYKLETSHNILRAVHSPYIWALKLEAAIETGRVEGDEWRQEIAKSMSYLHIQNLKSVWKRWLLEGIK